jgi:hypothetical protein
MTTAGEARRNAALHELDMHRVRAFEAISSRVGQEESGTVMQKMSAGPSHGVPEQRRRYCLG